jgi:hypothetical protein
LGFGGGMDRVRFDLDTGISLTSSVSERDEIPMIHSPCRRVR